MANCSLPAHTKRTEDHYKRLMKEVPKAYNNRGLQHAVGAWMQRTMFEFDITELTEIYNTELVSGFIALNQVPMDEAALSDLAEFRKSLGKKPLSPERRQGISDLLRVTSIDDAMFDILGDLQRNIIATAGEMRPDANTPAADALVREEIKLMRSAMNDQKNDFRTNLIETLAWRYQEVETNTIYELVRMLDKSAVRSMNRELALAYEAYLRDSTIWLHRQLRVE